MQDATIGDIVLVIWLKLRNKINIWGFELNWDDNKNKIPKLIFSKLEN